jgi:hypothetical protein
MLPTEQTIVTFQYILDMYLKHPLNVLRYMTFIGLVLFLLAPWIYKYVNLLLLYCFITPIGASLIYICPKYYKISPGKIITGKIAISMDIIYHWIPFFIIVYFFRNYYKKQPSCNLSTNVSIVIITLYILLADIEGLYDVCPITGVLTCLIGFCLYLLLVS